MNKVKGALVFALVASLGLGCGGKGLKSSGAGGTAAGGQSGTSSSDGAFGSGGSGTGGVAAGGAGGFLQGSGGSVSGGTIGTGGSPSSGGRSGSNAGGSAGGERGGSNAGGTVTGGKGGSNTGGSAGGTSGAGGTMCALVACPAIGCLYGELPNPDPCGCPICASPDAGTVKDAATDTCVHPPCASYPVCGVGYEVVTPACGCPTCVPVDAGQSDAIVCPPIGCPTVACANGTTRDLCGCFICVEDAGTDAAKLACIGLDECTCGKTSGCASIAEACYCPYPQCGNDGACICGGGQFIGCAPANLATCTAAKARVATLCPQLKGATFTGLCQQTDSACVTKCLNDATSCTDVFCSFCEGCDCASDAFMACRAKCTAALTP